MNLTQREMFAALALQGYLAAGRKDSRSIATDAVVAADNLIEALKSGAVPSTEKRIPGGFSEAFTTHED